MKCNFCEKNETVGDRILCEECINNLTSDEETKTLKEREQEICNDIDNLIDKIKRL